MKIKLSNYIAQFLVEKGINTTFMITGGGAMHLNDAFGHQEGMTCYYNHHEQASAIAAESYARITNKMALVSVTSGPGGTNAMTGVLGGWLDSIPMLVISGQVRFDTTARSTGLNLRAMGDQEFDIVKAVDCMTKYCEMVIDPNHIRYCLEKALFLAQSGRPGPCWLDIPLNVQNAMIETDDLVSFDPTSLIEESNSISDELITEIIDRIKNAQRPVINAGNGIRIANAHHEFLKLVELLQIPVVTGFNSIDLICNEHPLYAGRGGMLGNRAGNFAIQNADLVLSLGSRLSFRQVGFNYQTWAREAFTIIVDIDPEELKKPTLHVDLPVCVDVKLFMQKLITKLEHNKIENHSQWIDQCNLWRKKYPVVLPKHYESNEKTNIYAFMHELSSRLKENSIIVVGNGSACVVGSQAFIIKEGQRFIMNSGAASMGYDLPAGIGACVANLPNEVFCISGEGSLQMNIQELQTIITNKLPVKLLVVNNEGYHSIRQTQKNFFQNKPIGIGAESGDLGFPEFEKLAIAYGYPYFSCKNNSEIDSFISKCMSHQGALIGEIFVDTVQIFEPKSGTKKLQDGSLVSSPLENLFPFLSDEELAENMFIKPIQ